MKNGGIVLEYLSGSDKARNIQEMFSRLSLHYDLMNRIMTAGQDIYWRQEVIQRLNLPKNSLMLDIGAGTGDLTMEALRIHPDCHCVAADFTLEMMLIGREKVDRTSVDWLVTDALCLPFPANTYAAVVSGFLLRNVDNIDKTLCEQYRILKPGGKILILDTTRPTKNIFQPLVNFYMDKIIPFIGALISRNKKAYTYLSLSTEYFLLAEQLAARMVLSGFRHVGFHRLMFGTVAIHWGEKPEISGAAYIDSQLMSDVGCISGGG
jgi:demethylmenaquinone methyltransferase / 2-methoxy-6-polyprenyl-1,4-benzoquinol methylase